MKRQGQQIAAMLSNWESVEGALETAENAAGSAEREFARAQEGINFKLNQMANNIQKFWSESIDAESVRSFADILVSISSSMASFAESVDMGRLAMVGLTTIITKLITKKAMLAAATQKQTVATIANSKAATVYNAKLLQKAIAAKTVKASMIDMTTGATVGMNNMNSSMMATGLSTKQMQANSALMTKQMIVQNKVATIAAVKMKALAIAKSMAMTAGIALAAYGIFALVKALGEMNVSLDESIEKHKDLMDSTEDNINSINNEMESVVGLTEKINDSNTSHEDLVAAKEKLADIFPTIVAGYNSETGEIIINNAELERQIELNERLLESEEERLRDTGGALASASQRKLDELQQQMDRYTSTQQNLLEQIDRIGGDPSKQGQLDDANDALLRNAELISELRTEMIGYEQDMRRGYGAITAELNDATESQVLLYDRITRSMQDAGLSQSEYEDSTAKLAKTIKSSSIETMSAAEQNEWIEQTANDVGIAYNFVMSAVEDYKNSLEDTTEEQSGHSVAIAHTKEEMEALEKEYQSATDKLKDYHSILHEVDSAEGMSIKTKEMIISQYPHLMAYLGDEASLKEQLKILVKEEEEVQRNAFVNKLKYSEEFLNGRVNGENTLRDELSKAYNVDLSNAKNLAEAKEKVEIALINRLAGAWADYYNAQSGFFEGGAIDNLRARAQRGDAEARSTLNELRKRQNAIAEATTQLNSGFQTQVLNLSGINLDPINLSGISSPSGSSAKSSSRPSPAATKKATEEYKAQADALQGLNNQRAILENDLALNQAMLSVAETTKRQNELLREQIGINEKLQKNAEATADGYRKQRDAIADSLSSHGFRFSGTGDDMTITNLDNIAGKSKEVEELFNEFLRLQLSEIPKLEQSWWGYEDSIKSASEQIKNNLISALEEKKTAALEAIDETIDGIRDEIEALRELGKEIDENIEKYQRKANLGEYLVNDAIRLIRRQINEVQRLSAIMEEAFKNSIEGYQDEIDKIDENIAKYEEKGRLAEHLINEQIRSIRIQADEARKAAEIVMEGIREQIEGHQELREELEEDIAKYEEKGRLAEYLINQEIEALRSQTKEIEKQAQLDVDPLQKEIDRLKERNDQLSEEEERRKRNNDLVEAQIRLQNTMDQRNTRILQQQKDGSFEYAYVADPDKVASDEEAIKRIKEDNVKWEANLRKEAEIQEIQDKIDHIEEKADLEKEALELQIESLTNFIKEHNRVTHEFYGQEIDGMAEFIEEIKELESLSDEERLEKLDGFLDSYSEMSDYFRLEEGRAERKWLDEQIELLEEELEEKQNALNKEEEQFSLRISNLEAFIEENQRRNSEFYGQEIEGMNGFLEDLEGLEEMSHEERLAAMEDFFEEYEEKSGANRLSEEMAERDRLELIKSIIEEELEKEREKVEDKLELLNQQITNLEEFLAENARITHEFYGETIEGMDEFIEGIKGMEEGSYEDRAEALEGALDEFARMTDRHLLEEAEANRKALDKKIEGLEKDIKEQEQAKEDEADIFDEKIRNVEDMHSESERLQKRHGKKSLAEGKSQNKGRIEQSKELRKDHNTEIEKLKYVGSDMNKAIGRESSAYDSRLKNTKKFVRDHNAEIEKLKYAASQPPSSGGGGGGSGGGGPGGSVTVLHDGGIVGSKTGRVSEMVNKLFNLKPNEEMVKALKGELFIPPNNIVDNFIPNMNSLIGSMHSNPLVASGDTVYNIKADFPNVNSSIEIENAFKNIKSTAKQYAGRKGE